MSVEHLKTSSDIHSEVANLSTRLNAEYAEPVENHLVGTHLSEALGELSLHPAMHEEDELVIVPAAEREAVDSIDALIEKTKEMSAEQAAEAIERSEFKGPEVEEAIRSYYQDHNIALALVTKIIEGTPQETALIAGSDLEKLGIESHIIGEGLLKLAESKYGAAQSERVQNLTVSLLHSLYAEPSVGQLTLDNETIDRVASQIHHLEEQVKADYVTRPEAVRAGIERAIEQAQHEVRLAGQLLFHNTTFGKDVIKHADRKLRTQSRQHVSVQNGQQRSVRVSMGSDKETNGYSGANIHWSELYDPVSYKRTHAGLASRYKDTKLSAVTFAIPLAEIIKHTPYGRGVKYAVVQGDPNATAEKPAGSLTGFIGAGASDTMGKKFGSIDRVFWASDTNRQEATDYEIPIGGHEVTKVNPNTGQPESSTYVIQSDTDRLLNYRQWRESIQMDSDEYAQLKAHAKTLNERELLSQYGGVLSDSPDEPTFIAIRDLDIDESRTAFEALTDRQSILKWNDANTADEQAARAHDVIRVIQEQSANRFAGQYVVPLRAVYPEFMAGGDNSVNNTYGDRLLADARRVSM